MHPPSLLPQSPPKNNLKSYICGCRLLSDRLWEHGIRQQVPGIYYLIEQEMSETEISTGNRILSQFSHYVDYSCDKI